MKRKDSKKRKVKSHRFNGIKYDIHISPNLDGQCDFPRNVDATPDIDIFCKLNTKKGVQSLFHECLHAADWSKNEDLINRVADEIGDLFWRLNFRTKIK